MTWLRVPPASATPVLGLCFQTEVRKLLRMARLTGLEPHNCLITQAMQVFAAKPESAPSSQTKVRELFRVAQLRGLELSCYWSLNERSCCNAGMSCFFSNRSSECFQTGWRSRIRTWAHGSRVRCPTARLIARIMRGQFTNKDYICYTGRLSIFFR